jgi:hypothetical protein
VAGVRVDQLARAGNGRDQRVLLVTREVVTPAAHQQRRRRDAAELGGVVGLEHAFGERGPPHARRQLEALRDDCIEVRGRHGLGQRAQLELTHEVRIDRIRQRRDGFAEREHPRVTVPGRAGTNEHESEHPGRMIDRKALRDRAAHRVADDDGPVDAQDIHQRSDVVREVLGAVPGRGAVRVAMTALRHRDGAHPVGQLGQDVLE